jgi:putative CocE/NonD family hydrolase
MDLAPVTAFETGTNKWYRLKSWPEGCPNGCSIKSTPLYLNDGLVASFTAPKSSTPSYEEYISDPARPVPFRARPIDGTTWRQWLVDDQREQSGRTDVLAYRSEVLKAPVKIRGELIVNLVASTSGSDSDWVVKVIDQYPDEVAAQPNLGGYQLMISADVLRGRYREGFEVAKAIEPNKPLKYRFVIPTANHVFLPGHRIMVQIQSSWFPLYDRNPQTFVKSIFWAKPEDYKKATQRIYHAIGLESFIELPLVTQS